MLYSSRALCVSFLLALLGCSSGGGGAGTPVPNQGGAGGSHTSGVSGSAGSATQPTLGGSTNWGGAPSVGLTGGSGPNSGGFGGTGALGASGSGGAGSVTGGLAGTSHSGGAGGSGGANSRGPAPTFTTIYNTIITPNCGGSQCHLKRPTPFGYDFSSKSAASSSWRGDVTAGDADNSPMFQVLNFAIMPKDKEPLTVDQLFMVYDWINAGALDN